MHKRYERMLGILCRMKNLRLLLLHGGQWHEFERNAQILKELFETQKWNVESHAGIQPLSWDLSRFDGIILYTQGGTLNPAQEKALEKFLREDGKALIPIHCGNDSFMNQEKVNHTAFRRLIGSHFLNHPQYLYYEDQPANPPHPLGENLEPVCGYDELYMIDCDPDCQPVLTTRYQGKTYPTAYTKNAGNGRIYYHAHGHWHHSLKNTTYQKLLLRGIRWACKQWNESAPALNWAAIGYGGSYNMGKHHLESVAQTAGMIPVAACDIDANRVKSAAVDFPGLQTYTNINDLVRHQNLHGVTIITPHSSHAPLAIRCLEAGLNVIVEKPMALSIKECNAMIDAARRNDRMISVYHNRRWDNSFVAYEKLLRGNPHDWSREANPIGTPYFLDATMNGFGRPAGDVWRYDKAISGGSLYDFGVHVLFWVNRLMGIKSESEIVEVSAIASNRVWHHISNEDFISLSIRLTGNRMIRFETNMLQPTLQPKFRLFGDQGFIEEYWDFCGDATKAGKINLYEYRGEKAHRTEVNQVEPKTAWVHYYYNVANHLRHGEELEIKPAESKLIISMMDTAYESVRQQKTIDFQSYYNQF